MYYIKAINTKTKAEVYFMRIDYHNSFFVNLQNQATPVSLDQLSWYTNNFRKYIDNSFTNSGNWVIGYEAAKH